MSGERQHQRWASGPLFGNVRLSRRMRARTWLHRNRRLLGWIALGMVAWWVLSFVVTYALLDAGVV